jgi:hypothetical protein
MNMNLNEMQNVWNSPQNNLPTAEQQRLAQKFGRQMIRRRRFQTVWLVNTFVWLTIITVLAIRMVITGKVQLSQEWGLVPLLIVPWGFAIHFLRRHLKPLAPIARGEITIVESLRAARASNRETRSHLKLVGVLYVVIILPLGMAMRQLHAAGKVSERELTSMAWFFGGVLLVCTMGVAIRYFAQLLPQQKRLDGLLAELNAQ